MVDNSPLESVCVVDNMHHVSANIYFMISESSTKMDWSMKMGPKLFIVEGYMVRAEVEVFRTFLH